MKKDEVKYNIKFLKIIKKNPCIWNSNLSDYNKRDVVAQAWKQVSKEAYDTEFNCRDRWRTLRNSYLKSLRSNKNSNEEKKKYYLTDYFKFLQPFIKNYEEKNSKTQSLKSETSRSEDDNSTCSEENNSIDYETNNAEDAADVIYRELEETNEIDSTQNKSETTKENDSRKRSRHSYSSLTEGIGVYAECKKHKCNYNQDDSDELFVRSLVKYMKEMNSKQNRRFRLKVMGLVDTILDDSEGEMENANATSEQLYASKIPIVDAIKNTHPVLSALYSAEDPQKSLILPQQVIYYDENGALDESDLKLLAGSQQRRASIR